MSVYVGHLTSPGIPAPGDELDGRVAATGYDMDNGRAVVFRASREALSAYYASKHEDAYVVVDDSDVIEISGRAGRDLWSCAGVPWGVG